MTGLTVEGEVEGLGALVVVVVVVVESVGEGRRLGGAVVSPVTVVVDCDEFADALTRAIALFRAMPLT